MSIRSRLLLLVLGVWLPAVVGFGLLANQAYRNEQELALRRLEELGRGLNLLVERAIDARAALGRALAASAAVRNGDPREFPRAVRRLVQVGDSTAELIDTGGHSMSSSSRSAAAAPGPALLLPEGDAAPALARHDVEAFLARRHDDGSPVVAVLAPEPGVAEQRFNVAVTFPVAVIQAVVETQRPFRDDVLVSVLDDHLRVVARSVNPDLWIGKMATGELSRRASRELSGFGSTVTLDGISTSSYLSSGNRYGWQVVVSVPQANLEGLAQRLTVQTVAGSTVLLLIGLAVAFHNAQRIGSAVHALHGAARELAEDEVPRPVQTGMRETDEVGLALHRAGVTIYESTRQLEARVAEAVQEAKDAQSRLLDSQKHEAIGRLTGGLAHDFNNLLQAINSALEILEHRRVDDTDRRVIHAALRATTRATDLVRQMLAFGRTQSLRAEAVDLGELIRGSELLTTKAIGERARLMIQVTPGLPAVLVDPTQLELALLNLLFNARDALAEAGGQITIKVRRAGAADFAAHGPRGDFLCVEVADDGPGMDAEVRSRAFDPYYTTKPKGQGSGLGLAQVLAFARQSGGDAWITSEPGQGTRVTLMLPLASATGRPDGAVPDAPVADVVLDHFHVLMVEDDPLVSGVVVPALEQAGHSVTHCETADDALGLLATSRRFDIVCTDIIMPGRRTGLDLAAWCWRERPALPVIVATGYSAQQAPAGLTVLNKPYSIDAMIEAFREAISRADRENRVSDKIA